MYFHILPDKQEAVIVDLDRRLAIADYGEDYTPTDLGQLLKSEFTLNTKLSPEEKVTIIFIYLCLISMSNSSINCNRDFRVWC